MRGTLTRLGPPAIIIVLGDVAIGWMNYHATDDVQPVAGALIIGAFAFAFWRPRLAWLSVLLLWVAVPLSSIAGYATNYHPGLVKPAPLYETLVALVPAIIGAVGGAVMGITFQRSGQEPPRRA